MAVTTFEVRGAARDDFGAGSESNGQLSKGGELFVAQGLPSKFELSRLGATWYTIIPTASAFTNVAALPTTRAELALYNAAPSSGKSLVIDQIAFLSLTDVTAAAGVQIVYQVAAVAALTDNANVLISSPIGMAYNGYAQRALAVTTMTANKWNLGASANTGAAKTIGMGVVHEAQGQIIVRPGFTLGVNAIVGTATGTSQMSITWHEVEL